MVVCRSILLLGLVGTAIFGWVNCGEDRGFGVGGAPVPVVPPIDGAASGSAHGPCTPGKE